MSTPACPSSHFYPLPCVLQPIIPRLDAAAVRTVSLCSEPAWPALLGRAVPSPWVRREPRHIHPASVYRTVVPCCPSSSPPSPLPLYTSEIACPSVELPRLRLLVAPDSAKPPRYRDPILHDLTRPRHALPAIRLRDSLLPLTRPLVL